MNPYKLGDWRYAMWDAWKSVRLQVNQGAGWWDYNASSPPTFAHGRNSYRARP